MSLEFSKKQIEDYFSDKAEEIKKQFKKIVGEELDSEQFLFLQLLIASPKNTKQTSFKELEEFFENKQQLTKFIDWLFDYIQKGIPKPPKKSEKPKSKSKLQIVEEKQAENKDEEKTEPQLEKSSILTRVKKRQDQDDKQESPEIEKKVKVDVNPEKKKKCLFFPNCNKPECPFYHPTEQCPKFPKCAFGTQCFYIHPAINCKFGIACQRMGCTYVHPKNMNKFQYMGMQQMSMMNPFYNSFKKQPRKHNPFVKVENKEKPQIEQQQ